MPDDTLPIVFRSRRLTGFVMTAVGAGIVAAGIVKAADDSFSYADDHFGPFTFSSQTTGWLMIAIGLPFALYALVTVVRGCPTLTLSETGLLSTRCFGAPVEIPWNRFAHILIRHVSIPARGRVTPVDVLYLVTDDGKEISPGPVGEPRDIAAVIERVAARMKIAAQAEAGTENP